MILKPDLTDALVALNPGKGVGCDSIKHFVDNVEVTDFTEAKVKLVELTAEWDAQEYARNRESEFPSIQDLVVALYDTDDKSAVEAKRAAVKAKYPKPS